MATCTSSCSPKSVRRCVSLHSKAIIDFECDLLVTLGFVRPYLSYCQLYSILPSINCRQSRTSVLTLAAVTTMATHSIEWSSRLWYRYDLENFVGSSRGLFGSILGERTIRMLNMWIYFQTGDPTGKGTGGQSIWGEDFEDEFHPRLRFDKPYKVGTFLSSSM